MTNRTPAASDAATRTRMRRQRRRDTKPELAIRRAVHTKGMRYFVDRPPLPGMRRRADMVFPRARVAVFIDGCFWHRCPIHGTAPKRNTEWWTAKLDANVLRDRSTDAALEHAGWQVVRVWEHETPAAAATLIERVIRQCIADG